jgi:hypothetical protein
MTKPNHKPTREDGAYAAVLAFFRRYPFEISLVAPLAFLILLPTRELWAAVVAVIWLGEAIAYRLLTGRMLFVWNWRLVAYFAIVASVAVSQVIASARS